MAVQIFLLVDLDTSWNAVAHAHTATAHSRDEQQQAKAKRIIAVDIDPSKPEDPCTPLLADRPRHAVILTARGGVGFGPGGELEALNHLEPALITALGFLGITQVHQIAIEGQELGGEVLANSVAQANAAIDALVQQLQQTPQTARLAATA